VPTSKGSRNEAAIWLTKTVFDFKIPTTMSLRQRISGFLKLFIAE